MARPVARGGESSIAVAPKSRPCSLLCPRWWHFVVIGLLAEEQKELHRAVSAQTWVQMTGGDVEQNDDLGISRSVQEIWLR